MLFLDPWFYALIAVTAVLYRCVPQAWRNAMLLAVACGWLGCTLPLTLAVFAGAGAFAWVFGVLIARADQRPGMLAWTATGLTAAALIVARLNFDLFGGLRVSTSEVADEALKLIGVAYLALKMHHYFHDVAYERKALSWVGVLHYFLYLPTLVAGPLLRVREWRGISMCAPSDAATDVEVGMKRILFGLFKKIIVVALLQAGLEKITSALPGAQGLALRLPLSLIFIYIDFSGYSDIAVGVARLFGHRIRENFTWPFGATTMTHFWRSWNITIGDWNREHIYTPLGGMRASKAKTMGLVILVMLFSGMWHAFDLRFAIWGAYHGVLLAGERFFDVGALPPNAPAYKLWSRRAMVFAFMSGSAIFFMPEFWS